MRIKVTASKCLSNLDTDDPRSFRYPAKVYPLHPLHRIKHNPDLDIVFIHGILGNFDNSVIEDIFFLQISPIF